MDFKDHRTGEVEEEVKVRRKDYAYYVQLIRWEDGRHAVRFAYWKLNPTTGAWGYVRNGPTASRNTMGVLLRKALQKNWFRKQLKF